MNHAKIWALLSNACYDESCCITSQSFFSTSFFSGRSCLCISSPHIVLFIICSPWDWRVAGKCCWQNLLKMLSRTSPWGLCWARQPPWSASAPSHPEPRMLRCWKSWKQSLGTKGRWAGRRQRGYWREMETSWSGRAPPTQAPLSSLACTMARPSTCCSWTQKARWAQGGVWPALGNLPPTVYPGSLHWGPLSLLYSHMPAESWWSLLQGPGDQAQRTYAFRPEPGYRSPWSGHPVQVTKLGNPQGLGWKV